MQDHENAVAAGCSVPTPHIYNEKYMPVPDRQRSGSRFLAQDQEVLKILRDIHASGVKILILMFTTRVMYVNM